MGKLWSLINSEYVFEKDKIKRKIGHPKMRVLEVFFLIAGWR